MVKLPDGTTRSCDVNMVWRELKQDLLEIEQRLKDKAITRAGGLGGR